MGTKGIAKPISKSKTVWANAGLTVAGALVTLTALFDKLGQVLDAVDLAMLPEDLAAWLGGVLALVGAINVILRLVTSKPLRGTPAAKKMGYNGREQPLERK